MKVKIAEVRQKEVSMEVEDNANPFRKPLPLLEI